MSDPPTTTPSLAGPTQRSAVREVWAIAWPTVLTMSSYTVMQFVDKVMVAQVGPLEVAAQGNGGIWAFTPIAFAMGVLSMVNTYVSQNLGAGRPREGVKYGWAAIWLSVLVWLLVLLPLAAAMPALFRLMHHREAIDEFERLVELESTYGQILLLGGVLMLSGRGIHQYFFGMHRPKVVTIAAIGGNVVNVAANYVLIYGHFGAPRLGVAGAALGTVLGTAVELVIPLLVFVGPTMNRELGTRAAWRPAWPPIRDLLRIGWPNGAQFGNEILCWSVFTVVLVGLFGEDHLAAGWAVLGYIHLSFMPTVGISVAVNSLVGRYIGARRPDLAVARARSGLAIGMTYTTVCGLLFFVFREPLIDFFVADDSVTAERAARIIEIGSRIMVCAAIFQAADAAGIIYSGALRGAGDTLWPGVAAVVYSWLFTVGLGWLLTIWFPQWESVGPWIGAAMYIIILGITMAWRFEGGAWRRIDLLGRSSRDATADPMPRTHAS
jgi:MATE family multidrug resistance protein